MRKLCNSVLNKYLDIHRVHEFYSFHFTLQYVVSVHVHAKSLALCIDPSYHSLMSVISMSMLVCLPLPLYSEFIHLMVPQLILPDSIWMKIWITQCILSLCLTASNQITLLNASDIWLFRNAVCYYFLQNNQLWGETYFQVTPMFVLQIFSIWNTFPSSNEHRYNYCPSYLSADLAKYLQLRM